MGVRVESLTLRFSDQLRLISARVDMWTGTSLPGLSPLRDGGDQGDGRAEVGGGGLLRTDSVNNSLGIFKIERSWY